MEKISNIYRIQRIIKKERKKEQYHNILENEILPFGLRSFGKKFVFQHNNDPKHSSKICKKYLDKLTNKGKLEVMLWPPQSPDLNPIELLWDELDRNVRKICPTSTEHLWKILQAEWTKISSETLNKLLNRMPKICDTVIKKKGRHIDEAKM